jgi:hypothetical protein
MPSYFAALSGIDATQLARASFISPDVFASMVASTAAAAAAAAASFDVVERWDMLVERLQIGARIVVAAAACDDRGPAGERRELAIA